MKKIYRVVLVVNPTWEDPGSTGFEDVAYYLDLKQAYACAESELKKLKVKPPHYYCYDSVRIIEFDVEDRDYFYVKSCIEMHGKCDPDEENIPLNYCYGQDFIKDFPLYEED